jgi:heat shock protein beta
MPSTIPHDFFGRSYQAAQSVKLYVRRVFITHDVGDDFIPKWLNYLRIVIDADDLPLNVGRDSLQASRSLKQIQRNVVKKAIDMFANVARTDEETYNTFFTKASPALKLGTYEDHKNRPRLLKLLRFASNVGDHVSLDDYISRRKQGQKQIFYMAGAGVEKADLARSPFVERIVARGYEVFYFTEPMDGMVASTVGTYEGLKFQDVSKRGLLFGDEGACAPPG